MGFEWDDNNFATNHFLHPYHGAVYFTGARANGYTFWAINPAPFGQHRHTSGWNVGYWSKPE